MFQTKPKVVYVNHMGDDLDIVNDARISFSKMSTPLSTTSVEVPLHCNAVSKMDTAQVPSLHKNDVSLIKFLARGCTSKDWSKYLRELVTHEDINAVESLLSYLRNMPTHWTPFGHQSMKFRVSAPVPIRTQCFKHKIGMVENEESRRYIRSTPEIFLPDYRLAPEGSIKQGSGGPHPDNAYWQEQYRKQAESSLNLYLQQIEAGVAPEQARFSLPQGAVVNWVWTGSLYAFAEFYNKRSDRSHAQQEVADIADQIGIVGNALFPVAWSALTE